MIESTNVIAGALKNSPMTISKRSLKNVSWMSLFLKHCVLWGGQVYPPVSRSSPEEGLAVEDDFDVVVEAVVLETVLFIGCLVDKVVVGATDGKPPSGNSESLLNRDCI